MSEASDDPSGSSCPPPSLKMEERSECNDIYGRLTADPQEVEVGESVTLSWNVVCGDSDCVDRIGMFPEGTYVVVLTVPDLLVLVGECVSFYSACVIFGPLEHNHPIRVCTVILFWDSFEMVLHRVN